MKWPAMEAPKTLKASRRAKAVKGSGPEFRWSQFWNFRRGGSLPVEEFMGSPRRELTHIGCKDRFGVDIGECREGEPQEERL